MSDEPDPMNRIYIHPDGQLQFAPRTVLAPEDCVRYGGHCWYNTNAFVRGDGVSMVDQRCKHCTATRSGVSREAYEWSYPEDQP